MQKVRYTPTLQFLLILFLSIAILLTQANRLHMHLDHDDHASASEHVVNVHTASIAHDFELTETHEDHHPAAIDVTPDNFIKKTNILSPLELVFLFVGFFLIIPRLSRIIWHRLYKRLFTPCYYFLQPPQRAPPVK